MIDTHLYENKIGRNFVVHSHSCVWMFITPWTAVHQASCPSPSPGVCPSSCPLHQWCYLAILSSVPLLSSCLQSFPESGSFPMSQLFTSGGRSIGASALASVLQINIQGWFPLRLTGLISFLSNILSRVFSSTTVWKCQFFGALASLWSALTIVHDYWKDHSFGYMDLCQQNIVFAF